MKESGSAVKENQKKNMKLKNIERGIFKESYFTTNDKGGEPTALPDMISEANRIIEENIKDNRIVREDKRDRTRIYRIATLASCALAVIIGVLILIRVL